MQALDHLPVFWSKNEQLFAASASRPSLVDFFGPTFLLATFDTLGIFAFHLRDSQAVIMPTTRVVPAGAGSNGKKTRFNLKSAVMEVSVVRWLRQAYLEAGWRRSLRSACRQRAARAGSSPENRVIASDDARPSGTFATAQKRKEMVPRDGLEPSCPRGRQIFVPLRLSPPTEVVRGLEHAFTVAFQP